MRPLTTSQTHKINALTRIFRSTEIRTFNDRTKRTAEIVLGNLFPGVFLFVFVFGQGRAKPQLRTISFRGTPFSCLWIKETRHEMKISDILSTIEAQKDSSEALLPLEFEHLKKWGHLEKIPIPNGYAHLAGKIKEAYRFTLSTVGYASRDLVDEELKQDVFLGILFYVDYGQGEPRYSFVLNQQRLLFPNQNSTIFE